MREELYVIVDGIRKQLDLKNPSGITLNFKSNIFGDLSKITCSYSYTFKLPLTANNRRILDNAEDIRSNSRMIRRRLKCEFTQDGIPLFSNANLYIDSVENAYNAVMTWGVIDGFETLKDNDCSIRLLGSESTSVMYGDTSSKIDNYMNFSIVRPVYNAGLPYITANGHKDADNTYSFFPLPAVPIFYLILMINAKFKTKFQLGSLYRYNSGWPESSNHILINRGVVPLVKVDGSQEKLASCIWTFHTTDSYCGIGNILKGAKNGGNTIDSTVFTEIKDSENRLYALRLSGTSGMTIDIDGMVFAQFSYRPDGYNLDVTMNETTPSKPRLEVYCKKSGGGVESLTSIEGKWNVHYNTMGFMFDFSNKNGKDRLTIDVEAGAEIFFCFSCNLTNFKCTSIPFSNYFEFFGTYSVDNIKWNERTDKAGGFKTSVMSNLPDISCMTFMKALFFMMGAFPVVNKSGYIVPLYYKDIKSNLANRKIIDWSKKCTTDYSELPTKTSYNVSGFGQFNYFLMKNDELGKVENGSEDQDVYESGIGCIRVDNEVIEKSKTIIQLPFYSQYIKDNKHPKQDVGIMKFWYLDDEDKPKAKEAKPCIGIIREFPQYSGNTPTGTVWMGMDIWNGFPLINQDESYSYLSEILANPIIITENFNLNEFDLRDIDYSVPVYLQKYNAYFAIVSITRDSKGVCKCELIKLP